LHLFIFAASFIPSKARHSEKMVASDEIREVALTLAQDNLDDDAAEESVSHAMWLIKETAAREELSGPLGLDVGESSPLLVVLCLVFFFPASTPRSTIR
jgi:hypothetical protein